MIEEKLPPTFDTTPSEPFTGRASSFKYSTLEAASGEKKLKLEALPVNGSDDIVSKLSVSGNGQRNVEAASGEWHLKLETLPVNGSDDVVPKQGGKRTDYCGGGLYCQTGTYCCHNGGCCRNGWSCCSATTCCAGAAGLAMSTLGHVMTVAAKNGDDASSSVPPHAYISSCAKKDASSHK
ncbi:hypothetical protein MAR_015460 [Mya arenaria]|uniref:Chitin-binding type-1 domain-containing protein n=1 Tax=Mya arenaria TaxID=6604 RepID=A0ABY7FL73_MYAAR|nr:hypothetical protein MAR_015460 [Mya arenaria]